jgi:hypothetical protein
MRPAFVVREQPLVGQGLDLAERLEDVGVEDLLAAGAVEAFDKGVLVRLAWLDVAQRDLLLLAPGGEALRGELWTVVEAKGLGAAVECDELFEDADDAVAGIDAPTSMASASRLASSSTLSVRNRRPP